MSKIIDFIINICKWPVALLLLLYVPALIMSFEYFNFNTIKFYAFAGGVLFYGVMVIVAGYNTCESMQIISHELTHTFFAYLTLHNAGRIRLNPDGSGGSMIIKGQGNWIISLSPYFFPLFAAFYMLLMPAILIMSDNHWMVYCVFGFFVAYYWVTVLSQVHLGQTDIIKEGYVFSAIIIIGGNLLLTGILFSYTNKSWAGIGQYFRIVQRLQLQNIEWLNNLISQYF